MKFFITIHRSVLVEVQRRYRITADSHECGIVWMQCWYILAGVAGSCLLAQRDLMKKTVEQNVVRDRTTVTGRWLEFVCSVVGEFRVLCGLSHWSSDIGRASWWTMTTNQLVKWNIHNVCGEWKCVHVLQSEMVLSVPFRELAKGPSALRLNAMTFILDLSASDKKGEQTRCSVYT